MASCSHLSKDLSGDQIALPADALRHAEIDDATTSDPTAKSGPDEAAPVEDVVVLEEAGFCPDNIYSQYLAKQYESVAPLAGKIKKYRSNYSRKKARKQHEADALSFARDRFVGTATPYFGAIPVVTNPSVDHWIRYFKGRGRRDFMRWLVRGESMRKTLSPVLKDHGIPDEFFYLAMIESGFNNRAYSSASATGTWQFMTGTARLYGLKVNYWLDERRDPVKSTVAAASYLRDLYAQLGDWYLAMASYNAGPGRLRRAIRNLKTRDFWEIAQSRYLPGETKQYVPKMLAALLLAHNARSHGFEFGENTEEEFPSTVVYTDRPIQLSELAEHLGVSLRDLSNWNPELIRGITPPGVERYPIRLADDYAHRWAAVYDKLSVLEIHDVEFYKVRSGDTLSQIARRYKIKVNQILSLNPQLRPKTLRIGKTIAIPVPGIVVAKQTEG